MGKKGNRTSEPFYKFMRTKEYVSGLLHSRLLDHHLVGIVQNLTLQHVNVSVGTIANKDGIGQITKLVQRTLGGCSRFLLTSNIWVRSRPRIIHACGCRWEKRNDANWSADNVSHEQKRHQKQTQGGFASHHRQRRNTRPCHYRHWDLHFLWWFALLSVAFPGPFQNHDISIEPHHLQIES